MSRVFSLLGNPLHHRHSAFRTRRRRRRHGKGAGAATLVTVLLGLAGPFGHPALAGQRRARRASPPATLRHPASLRPSPHILVRPFGRFDEITYLVEKTSDLTLPVSRPQGPRVRCDVHVAIRSQIAAKSALRQTLLAASPPSRAMAADLRARLNDTRVRVLGSPIRTTPYRLGRPPWHKLQPGSAGTIHETMGISRNT